MNFGRAPHGARPILLGLELEPADLAMPRRHLASAARLALALVACLAAARASAQLRIVDYNIAQNSHFNSDPTDLNAILTAIGADVRNGFARPIDVMANQELTINGSEAAFIVGQLNGIYGAGTYAAAPVPAGVFSGGNGLPSLIYNTTTVSLINTIAFGNAGDSADQQPRSTLRYRLRPVGYGESADFYLYNSHYKADDDEESKTRRLIEATSIRDNSDALGEGTHALYVGDYNVYTHTEAMYQKLLSAGPGQAFDPAFRPGSWSNTSSFKDVHTQSPATSSAFSGQTLLGMDDRFDFQLATTELNDAEGLSIIPGSYHAFGNNGNHFMNGPINVTPVGATLAAPQPVLDALTRVSDHIPVVLDMQLPARMGVDVAAIPASVPQGSPYPLAVTVQNLVSALTALGGDELDYTLSVAGNLFGGANGVVQPLAAGNVHQITLDASTLGPKSGTITVTATSQGAGSPLFTLPVSYTVDPSGITPLPPNSTGRMAIARDDFDAPLNRIDFTQSPAPGAYNSTIRGFQRYQVGVTAMIPTPTLDQTVAGTDSTPPIGVINAATKTDGWFGVADTRESPANPEGNAVATWQFDVAGATALDVSIDMGACGNFEAASDNFNWTYSFDGGAFQPLFTSSINEASFQSYTFANGTMTTIDDPLVMTTTANQSFTLSNALQTLTSALTGSGNVLTLQLNVNTDSDSEGYAFDNIVVTGLVSFLASDFNKDGAVNSADLAAWRTGFGTPAGATKAQGDADNDGDVDSQDFSFWQRQLGMPQPGAVAAGGAVPEPGAITLVGAMVACLAINARRWRW
jgi:hypothetical protein